MIRTRFHRSIVARLVSLPLLLAAPTLAGPQELRQEAKPTEPQAHAGCNQGTSCRHGAEADRKSHRGCDHSANERRGHAEEALPRGMRDGHGMGGGRGAMQSAMSLVHEFRGSIERTVVEIDQGVVTTTVSPGDPDAARMLVQHVNKMKRLLESGGRVRAWDPLFREIFDRYEEIDMLVEPIDGGVRVTETSNDPEVAKLIQAHARKVDEFLARGPAAVHEATPLPEGYTPSDPASPGERHATCGMHGAPDEASH